MSSPLAQMSIRCPSPFGEGRCVRYVFLPAPTCGVASVVCAASGINLEREMAMTEAVQAFDLDWLGDGDCLARTLGECFDACVLSVSPVGAGFYARVFKVALDGDPWNIIVKCHKYPGRSQKEGNQLAALREVAVAKVPRVYALHPYANDFPCEALSMEVIPGINASKVVFPDVQFQQRFVEQAVENLLVWHAVSNERGFGELQGPFTPTWVEYFKERIASYHRRLHQDERRAIVSDYVMRIVERSFETMDLIFRGSSPTSSLVHSDYNAWNMMVDPETFELTGIIDPIDAGWSDSEIDLFHLPNCRPELGLLERYLQEICVDEGFWLRFRFYRFWDDVKHYVRMGWYEEGRFRRYAEELESSMREMNLG